MPQPVWVGHSCPTPLNLIFNSCGTLHERDPRAYIQGAAGYHDRWPHDLESQFKANCVSPRGGAGAGVSAAPLERLGHLSQSRRGHAFSGRQQALAGGGLPDESDSGSSSTADFVLARVEKLGTSELLLRLPSVIAGTVFCWIFFRWLTRLLGPTVGWVGFILVGLLPVFIELSSEVASIRCCCVS